MVNSPKRVYIETYGCQMNLADSEIVLRLLDGEGYQLTRDLREADIVLVNTCSIRDHAEQRIYGRLGEFKNIKNRKPEIIIGVLGCMAERLRLRLTNEEARGVGRVVDVIVGPDEYRKLPGLLKEAWHGARGIAVQLSRVETYDDIVPLRSDGISAWVSVMRGCDKFCTFCVVPFTRGRERSRSLRSVVDEVIGLSGSGYREVTLLGQNVNSYRDGVNDFADLLREIARVDRSMRIRFTTSHPQDMSDKLIETVAGESNVCKYIHLPVQSGSDRILASMNRLYSRDEYLRLVGRIRAAMPQVSLSTDIIAGFPGEGDEDHRATMRLMEGVRYDGAFMFKYSPRENTPAVRLGDTVADDVKTRRIGEIIQLQNRISYEKNLGCVGRVVTVLAEGTSKKSESEMQGRTDDNRTVIFPRGSYAAGDYVDVRINRSNSATLFGVPDRGEPALVSVVGALAAVTIS